jgi:hypothetical protein
MKDFFNKTSFSKEKKKKLLKLINIFLIMNFQNNNQILLLLIYLIYFTNRFINKKSLLSPDFCKIFNFTVALVCLKRFYEISITEKIEFVDF